MSKHIKVDKNVKILWQKCQKLVIQCDKYFLNGGKISIKDYSKLLGRTIYLLRRVRFQLARPSSYNTYRLMIYLECVTSYARILDFSGRKLLSIRVSFSLLNKLRRMLSELSHINTVLSSYGIKVDNKIKIIEDNLLRCKCTVEGNIGNELYNYKNINKNTFEYKYIIKQADKYIKSALNTKYLSSKDFKFLSKDHKNIQKRLKNSYITLPKISIENMNEYKYRKWICNNCLALNVLNDTNYNDINVSGDTLDVTTNNSADIFNLIKQEYISARYQLYYGLMHYSDCKYLLNKKSIYYSDNNHLSDRQKYMQSKLPNISNYYIEQMKSAFKTFSSIFNQIAFLLINYFKKDIYEECPKDSHFKYNERSIDFHDIFNSPAKFFFIRDGDSYLLQGLYWISRDLDGLHWDKGDSTLDKLINSNTQQDAISRELRDGMEHRCFHVTKEDLSDYKLTLNGKEHYRTVSFDMFKKLDIHYMKTCRETIILFALVLKEFK